MNGDRDPAVTARVAVAALEQMPAVVWAFTGPDHVAVVANQAAREYRNGSRSHLLGKSLRESLAAENKPLIALLDEVYRTGVTRTFYETTIKVDDEERFVNFTAAPLRDEARTEVIGVITYMTDVTDSVLAKRAAEREHAVLQALQERLLPTGLPVLPQVRIAARYRAAGEQLAAGGDWYDAVPLSHGRVAASVGDVLGHGPEAAAVMGQLRSVLSAALLHGGEVIAALRQLEQYVQTLPAAHGSTACVVIFDPGSGRLCYAAAGHPPPVLIGPDGTVEFLVAAPSAPLGLPGPAGRAGAVSVPPGGAVLLYSDGVIERPGTPTEHGRQQLLALCRQALREHVTASGIRSTELVDTVMTGLTAEALADDAALLAVCYPVCETTELRVELPATPDQLTPLRLHLHHWLEQSGISEDDVVPLQIASGEAAANAVEHAYRAMPTGTMTLSAELTAESTVRLRVQDHGRWCGPAPKPGSRGRGLLLMQQCMDDLHVFRGAEGTTVEMVRRVHASEVGPVPPSASVPDVLPALQVRVVTTAHGEVGVLSGDLDAASVPTAAIVLRGATRGGVLPLTVDLTGLAHLTSAGVKLLFDLADEAAAIGSRLTVRVVRGSTAHHVLELTGFADLAILRVSDHAATS